MNQIKKIAVLIRLLKARILLPKQNKDDFSDYLSNLEDYEERLARGEIKW